MAFGELNIASDIMSNAPKYKQIVEPFADNGSVAFYKKKSSPKVHIVNYEDVELFTIMSFIQNVNAQQKKALKQKDWVGHPDTFAQVQTISAVDGVDFFYKFFYSKHFTMKTLDKEAPPKFDFLKMGLNVSSLLFKLPVQKAMLKKATLTNDIGDTLVKQYSNDTFLILVPKGEVVESVNQKIKSISSPYYFSIKSKSNDDLATSVIDNTNAKVSTFAKASIMMAQMQVITNYDNRIKGIDIEQVQINQI